MGRPRLGLFIVPALGLLPVVSCGGGGGGSSVPAPAVSVTVSPATASLTGGTTRSFTAAVAGSSDPAVAWSVVEAGGGTVSAAGLYTAPATAGTYHVRATAAADASRHADATVTVVAAPAVSAFTAAPSAIDLGASAQLTATFSGGTAAVDQGVGAVTSGAPASVSPTATTTYTLTVTNSLGATATQQATVTLNPVAVGVSPAAPTVTAGLTRSFSATVTGAVDTGVTWSMLEAGGGAVTSGGLYTAPATPGAYHVRATSAADPSRHADAAVTVVAAPAISAFTATPAAIDHGASAQLAATYSGGAGTVDHGVGALASGGQAAVSPSADTTYTLTVTNAAGTSVTQQAAVTLNPVAVSVSPAAPTVTVGLTRSFSATVTGATDGSVTWSVEEAGGGSVSAAGLYTAPGTPGTYHVRATSTVDATAYGRATVTVAAAPVVSVTVSPTPASLNPNGTLSLSASVTGAADPSVTWAVSEAGGGSVVATGASTATYTAPTTPGTYHVVATSVADGTKSATATLTVNPLISISVSPVSPTLTPGAVQSFSATVTGSADTSVTWAITEAGGGNLGAGSGSPVIYTAPNATGTYHLVATSGADPTKTATATATITVTSTVSVSVIPATLQLRTVDAGILLVDVTGATDATVAWSVQEGAAGGAVDVPSYYARYRPPASSGTYHVVATSHEDASKSGTATVTVLAAPAVPTLSATAGAAVSARITPAAVRLGDGTVLLAGGYDGFVFQDSAEVFDPATGTFAATAGSMATGRNQFAAAPLDGTHVLVAGGDTPSGATTAAEVFDAGAGTFAPTGALATARLQHAAVRLGDGRVLVIGGLSAQLYDGGHGISTLEAYAGGAFGTLAQGLHEPRGAFTATLLQDGRVLIVGGLNEVNRQIATAEIFDPSDDSVRYTAGSLYAGRSGHTATLLADGRVLITGGSVNYDRDPASAEIYDPATDRFTLLPASMAVPRRNHAAALLGDGRVLLTGGEQDWSYAGTAETFDPATGTFSFAGLLRTPRSQHAAVPLLDGRVLLLGGSDGAPLATAETFP